MYLSDKLYAKKLTAWKYSKTLKLALTFVSLVQKGYFLRYRFTVYSLSQLTWSDLDRENAKEITLESSKITVK